MGPKHSFQITILFLDFLIYTNFINNICGSKSTFMHYARFPNQDNYPVRIFHVHYTQGVQPNFSEQCGNVGMAMKMWEFFFKCGNY